MEVSGLQGESSGVPARPKGFRVEYGLDTTGLLVRPDQATRGNVYRCPSCLSLLSYRQGPHRRAHFSHRGGTGCSPETIRHRTAKRLLCQRVRQWQEGLCPAPILRFTCPGTRGHFNRHTLELPLPDRIVEALEEVEWRGLRFDVALLDENGETVAGVEVWETHRVPEDKARRIEVPWGEIQAKKVLDDPSRWDFELVGNFRACSECRRRDARAEQEIRDKIVLAHEVARRNRIAIPSGVYRPTLVDCHACGQPALFFHWPGKERWTTVAPPREGRPRSVCFVKSREVREGYWGNRCLNCRAILGDFYHHWNVEGCPIFEGINGGSRR